MNESRWLRRGYASLLVLVGVTLATGGAMLAVASGSLYYLVAGVIQIVAGVLIWRADRRGAWLYGALLVGTLAWAIWEVGDDTWGLVARLAMPCVLGIPVLLLPVGIADNRGRWVFVGAIVLALGIGAGLHAITPRPDDPLLQLGTLAQAVEKSAQPSDSRKDWVHYGNDLGGTRFSPLTQITPQNVSKLEVAWEADLGPETTVGRAALEVTPINVGGVLYLCNGYNAVIALDAETGTERWRFDMTREAAPSGKPCRGVAYYQVPGATGMCSGRIVAASQSADLFALDAATGKSCPGFGNEGRVSLREGMGQIPAGYHYVSSAPQIVRGNAVVGGAIMDGQYWGEPSGVIRAYDLVTGQLAWAFDVGRPDQHGALPPGEIYTPATPNSWAPLSADETLGLVYLPIGNATPDFYGAQRRPFDDEISSSVIALDAETGTLVWRFQTVHHDIWDYDVPAQPTLIDLPLPNGVRRALIQPTKRGEIFVLDRETGDPIKEVRELPVPQGGLAEGERLSAMQPFSVGMPSFRGRQLREADMWGLTPIDQMMCRILFKKSRYEGALTPVSLERPTIVDPGYGGGINWGGISVDTDNWIMMVNWTRVPSRVELLTRAEADERGFGLFDGKTQGGGAHPQENTPFAAWPSSFLSPLEMPCTAPPWGQITAVDLKSGKVVWSKPLGDGRDSGPWGIRSHLPFNMGVPNIGGSVTTRGGIVFIGATADSVFRAFDAVTGEELWHAVLPGGGQATPMTYESPGGRQFVVIAAGGKPSMRTRLSTKVVAYALPR